MSAAEAAAHRFVRGPLRWALLLVVLLTPFVVHDLHDASEPLVPEERSARVQGTVRDLADADGGDIPVTYVHPVTEQTVKLDITVHRSRLRPRHPGPVSLVVDRDNPDAAWVAGDRVPTEQNLLIYAWLPLVPVLLSALRWWRLRSLRRLQEADLPSYAMLGAITGPRRSAGRCLMQLYELDAGPGGRPLCTVPLVTTDGAPLAGPALPVEVKGVPRSGGLVIARIGDLVPLPSGRALLRNGRPRPLQVEPLNLPAQVAVQPGPVGPPPQARSWYARAEWRLPVAGGALLLLGLVAVLTAVGAREAPSLARGDDRVVARVTKADPSAFEVEIVYTGRSGKKQRTSAGADFPEEYTVDRIYPAVVDKDDPTSARLLAEPYDAVEPVVWGALPLLVVLLPLSRWARKERHVRAVQRRGSWATFTGWRTHHAALSVLRPGTRQVACVVAVEPAQLDAIVRLEEYVEVELAGTPAPGEPIALRHSGHPLTVRGPARADA